MNWEFGVCRCKLLLLEWINNKVLMYNTGYYIQYLVINHNGKEYKKIVYICVKKKKKEIQQIFFIKKSSFL